MKRNFSVGLALSALILTCGCKKSIKSDSVDLSKGTKGGFTTNPDWQTPGKYGRVIHYDIGDGFGADCLLAWDINSGEVSLTQISLGGTGSSTVYQNLNGFLLNNGNSISVTQYNSDCSDPYNEVGGVHIIPYDANGSGHEDHLLIYVPGRGMIYLIHWVNGGWQDDWNSANGIGGYDLLNTYDKIITYDYGLGASNYLMLYRPGGGIVWLMHNNSTASNPSPSTWNWTPDLQSNNGIGGFDMKDPHDQLLTIGGPSQGNMDLCAYTPAFGYVWLINHIAYEAFQDNSPGMYSQTSRTGLYDFSFAYLQDRVVALTSGSGGSTGPEENGEMLCYRPGFGIGAAEFEQWDSETKAIASDPIPTGAGGINDFMNHDPYGSSPYTYIGDHIISFGGGGSGDIYNNLLIYSNGGNSQSELYYQTSSGGFNQVY